MWLWGSSNKQVLTGQIVATRGTTPLWTDTIQNITFPQLHWRVVKKQNRHQILQTQLCFVHNWLVGYHTMVLFSNALLRKIAS